MLLKWLDTTFLKIHFLTLKLIKCCCFFQCEPHYKQHPTGYSSNNYSWSVNARRSKKVKKKTKQKTTSDQLECFKYPAYFMKYISIILFLFYLCCILSFHNDSIQHKPLPLICILIAMFCKIWLQRLSFLKLAIQKSSRINITFM